jgi:hypothetical protein
VVRHTIANKDVFVTFGFRPWTIRTVEHPARRTSVDDVRKECAHVSKTFKPKAAAFDLDQMLPVRNA